MKKEEKAKKQKIKEFLADICVKIFQIIFGLLVVGMFIRDKFNPSVFISGLIVSLFVLTTAIAFYYNAQGGDNV